MKIGVLGGTFDPVHNGHIYMATHCMDKLGLDKIMFLPNGNPPHKKGRKITDKHHRYSMLNLALESFDDFFVSDYEINRESYSYTVETLRYFKTLTNDEFNLIIGADSFYQLNLWYKFTELLKENKIIVLDREYGSYTNIEKDIDDFNLKYSSHISLCKMPLVNISSTRIREMFSRGEDISGMVPENVLRYILQNKLYTDKEEK